MVLSSRGKLDVANSVQVNVGEKKVGEEAGLCDVPWCGCLLEDPHQGRRSRGGRGGNCPPNIKVGGALPPQVGWKSVSCIARSL